MNRSALRLLDISGSHLATAYFNSAQYHIDVGTGLTAGSASELGHVLLDASLETLFINGDFLAVRVITQSNIDTANPLLGNDGVLAVISAMNIAALKALILQG